MKGEDRIKGLYNKLQVLVVDGRWKTSLKKNFLEVQDRVHFHLVLCCISRGVGGEMHGGSMAVSMTALLVLYTKIVSMEI